MTQLTQKTKYIRLYCAHSGILPSPVCGSFVTGRRAKGTRVEMQDGRKRQNREILSFSFKILSLHSWGKWGSEKNQSEKEIFFHFDISKI